MGGQLLAGETAVGAAALGLDRRRSLGARWGPLRIRSDAALALRYADGDQAAFSILYERHRRAVFAVCLGVLGSREDAEDAVQETFASLAATLPTRPPREFRAWLARVARNAAIDLIRRPRARASLDDAAFEIAAPVRGGREEIDSVLAGIRELPESQRTALVMRELAGYSYQEIGVVLAVEAEAVRGLIARARIGLRNHREATELPCSAARQALAAEPDGRRLQATARRHLRHCAACRAYRDGLRSDARALRGVPPLPAGSLAGGGALAGLGAKLALAGGAMSQAGAVCAVSVCAVGGAVFLYHDVARPTRVVARHAAATRTHIVGLHRAAGGAAHLAGAGAQPAASVTQLTSHSNAGHASATVTSSGVARPTDHVNRSLTGTAGSSGGAGRPHDGATPQHDGGSAPNRSTQRLQWGGRGQQPSPLQSSGESGHPTPGHYGGMDSGRDVHMPPPTGDQPTFAEEPKSP